MLRTILLRGRPLRTPAFVPSISSATTPHSEPMIVEKIIDSLRSTQVPSLMVSVYDLVQSSGIFHKYAKDCFNSGQSMRKALGLANGTVIFLDSGAYELQHFEAMEWYDPLDVYAVQRMLKGDVFVILDYPTNSALSSADNQKRIEKTIDSARQIANWHTGAVSLMAIAHGYDEESLVECAGKLAQIDEIDIIGVSSREPLGQPLVMRLAALLRLRETIVKRSSELALHLLAAGDITLWPIYSLLGVDLFDSTNWIDRVATPFQPQWTPLTDLKEDELCTCATCKQFPDKSLHQVIASDPYNRLTHNLNIVFEVMTKIRKAIRDGKGYELAFEYCGEVCTKLEALLGKRVDRLT